VLAGNSPDLLAGDWVDPAIAGLENEADLRAWWVRLVDGMGSGSTLFRRGLDQKFDGEAHPELARDLIALRPAIQAALVKAGLDRHVYFFDQTLYNPALPVVDNLVFASPRQPITRELLAEQTEFLEQIRQLDLEKGLVRLTQDVVDLLRQIFGIDGTDHPLFRKLGLDPDTFEAAVGLVNKARADDGAQFSDAEMALLLIIPFRISAEQIGAAFPDEMKARVLALRHSHAAELQQRLDHLYAPLHPDLFAPGLSVLENALFGKISDASGGRADDVRTVVSDTIAKAGAKQLVIELIFDLPISLGGANLPALYAEPLAFSRATIKRPDVLVLDNALASYDLETQVAVYKNLRSLLPDTTLIYLNAEFQNNDIFDVFFELRQGRIVSDTTRAEDVADTAASADLTRKVRALQQTELFSGLNRRELRLLAFGARWYEASAGEYVFRKDDDPTDGAYMILEGEAGLYLPKDGAADQLISQVGPGRLVGELGLIRNVPRALDMKAETDLKCLRIGAEEFLAVVENDAATSFKLLQVVASYV
jgi:hypothetical protein